jgi:hypothetical protein
MIEMQKFYFHIFTPFNFFIEYLFSDSPPGSKRRLLLKPQLIHIIVSFLRRRFRGGKGPAVPFREGGEFYFAFAAQPGRGVHEKTIKYQDHRGRDNLP